MQAIRMGRSDKVTGGGLLISAVMIPLIGIGSVLIGLFMRVNGPVLENTKDAFPQFVLTYMPDWLSGIVMGTLLLAIIGSGAAGVLAAGITISEDIIQTLTRRFDAPRDSLRLTRICIVIFLLGGCLMSTGALGDFVGVLGCFSDRQYERRHFWKHPLLCAGCGFAKKRFAEKMWKSYGVIM